jgi:hypothetical protein
MSPELARFEGMSVVAYPADHPKPHVHVVYGEYVVVIEIRSGAVRDGSLPPAKLKRVQRWVGERREELLAAWNNLRSGRNPGKIEPPSR